jgi:polysaccharide biosynthesis/export protein
MNKSRARALWIMGFAILCLRAFSQQTGEPVVREYRIGPKDLLEITVFERPELNQTVRVTEDGSITLPLLGKVRIEGLTKEDVEKKLTALLEEKYLQKARVIIFIREYQSQLVSLIGAVAKPGMYELIGPTTLLQMISKAGGLTDRAPAMLYIIRRSPAGGQSRIDVDLEDLVHNGNQDLNVPLQADDIINIPMDQLIQVFVFGEVRSPGALQVWQSKKINILQAVAQAGGLTDSAAKTRVTITRKDKRTGRPLKIKVNLNDIIKGRKLPDELQEGDVVYVPVSLF